MNYPIHTEHQRETIEAQGRVIKALQETKRIQAKTIDNQRESIEMLNRIVDIKDEMIRRLQEGQ